MHDDVAKLAREGRLVEAADVATARGELADASVLFERACEWERAARSALSAGNAGDALRLASLGGIDALAEAALDALAGRSTKQERFAHADALERQGHHAWAARTFERAEAPREAAHAWERAGDAIRAARLLEASGDAAGALKVLDAGLRREPDRADLRVALGAMLLRCGKAPAALRAVQQVAADAPERREALRVVRAALTLLGMNDARAEVDTELATLGDEPEAVLPVSVVRPESTVAPRLYGRYTIVREVSSTATARLLECEDTLRGERVALKIFSSQVQRTPGAGRDALMRFTREARVLAELAHPNIVPLRDVLEQGPALVLAWMPGGTLEEHLAKGPMTPAHAVDVARAVFRALGEAHRIGVVHRDVKPANILFDAAGTARLADFGVAHLGDLSVTATAGVFGSLAYMSPEQREGRPATARSDLFGVGVVLLEMLTGARPVAYDGGTADSLAAVHRNMGAAHDAVTRALIARDPRDRPEDAFEAARALSTLEWPGELDPGRTLPARAKPVSFHPPSERLALPSLPGGMPHDRWLDRPVRCVPLDDRALARAIAFARIAHPALQAILRVDRDHGSLWLGVPRGEALARSLRTEERAALVEVMSLLHAEGVAHGDVRRESIVLGEDGPVLLFPSPIGARDATGTRERDLAALAKL